MRCPQSLALALVQESVVSSVTATSWAFGGPELTLWAADADSRKCFARDLGLLSFNLHQPVSFPGLWSDGTNYPCLQKTVSLPPLGGIDQMDHYGFWVGDIQMSKHTQYRFCICRV